MKMESPEVTFQSSKMKAFSSAGSSHLSVHGTVVIDVVWGGLVWLAGEDVPAAVVLGRDVVPGLPDVAFCAD